MEYRKKPVVISAIQWNGHNFDEIKRFAGNKVFKASFDRLQLTTLNGDVYLDKFEWVICGIAGEFYPCENGIFKETYEAV